MVATPLCLLACGHGSDDRDECWGCAAGELEWPYFEEPVRVRYGVVYAPGFVADVRRLGGRRFPLYGVPPLMR